MHEEVGTGLSGTVYRATQRQLGRDVAVKFFDNQFSRENESLRKRFLREAKLLARAEHQSIPYVVTTGSVSLNDGGSVPYTVMQFIDGQSVETLMQARGKLEFGEAVAAIRQVLEALDAAHKQNIVHRDVKPGNIMMNKSKHCFLIDFSIGVERTGATGLTRTTSTGEGLGSPDYMSPEQHSDASSVDHKTDIYSVGVVLKEMLTGNARFRLNHLDVELSHLSDSFREILRRACADNPIDRYPTAEGFRAALRAFDSRKEATRPMTALCTSLQCPSAQWSQQGYYKGPRIVPESTNNFCGDCGEPLLYGCSGCGAEYNDDRFCGNCGTKFSALPECGQCGSHLKRPDLTKDTASEGCGKCRVLKAEEKVASTFGGGIDDDIPF
jgi:serine/threonine protein kinase